MKRIVDPGGQWVLLGTWSWENAVILYVHVQRDRSDMCPFACALRLSSHSLIASISSIHLIKDTLNMKGNVVGSLRVNQVIVEKKSILVSRNLFY